MERRLRLPCTHASPISALSYHPVRREFITGHKGKSVSCDRQPTQAFFALDCDGKLFGFDLCIKEREDKGVEWKLQPLRLFFFADGTLKFWEADTGRHAATASQHMGWITDLFYWYWCTTTRTCTAGNYHEVVVSIHAYVICPYAVVSQ